MAGMKPHASDLLTVQELAQRLRIHEATLYRLLQRGKIPSHKIADRRYFTPEDVERFMQLTAVPAREVRRGGK